MTTRPPERPGWGPWLDHDGSDAPPPALNREDEVDTLSTDESAHLDIYIYFPLRACEIPWSDVAAYRLKVRP